MKEPYYAHHVKLEVDTEDHKALRGILSLLKEDEDDKKDGLADFIAPIRRQLRSLQERMQRGLLDLETPLVDRQRQQDEYKAEGEAIWKAASEREHKE